MKRLSSAFTSVTVLLFAAAVFLPPPAYSATLDPSGVDEASIGTSATLDTTNSIAKLEKVFWVCDYAATTEGVDRQQAAVCANATDELKQAKFGGSFEKMLEWWRFNKVTQHRALQQTSLAQSAQ